MGGELILVVEDNELNLKLVRDLLEVHGYQTAGAKDGLEGMELAQQFMPRMILMDLQLPKMDGLEVTRRLKADPQTRHIPIYALTAFAMKGDEQKAREAGCDGYITKPIETRSLIKRVKEGLTAEEGKGASGQNEEDMRRS